MANDLDQVSLGAAFPIHQPRGSFQKSAAGTKLGNLLGIIGRWIIRNVLSLLLIVAVLVAAGLIQKEIKAYLLTRDAIAALKAGKALLERDIQAQTTEFAERAQRFKAAGDNALAQRMTQLEQEIARQSAAAGTPPDPKLCVLLGGEACATYFEGLRRSAGLSLLVQERDYLASLRTALALGRGTQELERLRQVHAAVYGAYQDSEAALSAFKAAHPTWWLPLSQASQRVQPLDQKRDDHYAQNKRAHEAYVRQQHVLEAIKTADALVRLTQGQVAAVFQSLDQEIGAHEAIYRNNWVTLLLDSVNKVLPTALALLLGIMFTPIAIKAFFYFLIAPIASRRAAITLLPDVSGQIEGLNACMTSDADRLKVSEVSQAITLQPGQELLIHPEYLQSSATQGEKATQWLLDWSYPLTSLAAGLFGLTRIRTAATAMIVVSATKDPLSEVGVISLPAGSALVFQPHRLIGVVQQQAKPLKITRHWRLGTLNAWLTLQLRYLVFHGPAQLVVKGCRGVRVERAHQGRSINQAATIGFSANLAYSTLRCETFGAYLMGRQELFNDHFGGGPGFYVYEEMPHGGTRTGLFGRGLEGFADSILKVLGV